MNPRSAGRIPGVTPMKMTSTFIGYIALVVLGVLLFLLAVSGALFQRATPVTDIGLYSVVVVLVGIGLLGIWAKIAEAKEAEE